MARPDRLDVLVAAALVVVGQLEVWLAADVDAPRGLVALGARAATAPVAGRDLNAAAVMNAGVGEMKG
jgi:hypothetical protein